MFQQSSSRNSQNNRSKVKRALQIALLMVAVIWLLKHINRNEYVGGDQISADQEDVDFGRKGKAGSENVIIIDGQRRDFDEIPETNEAGDQAEAFGQHTEEKNEQEQSQEFIANNGQRETPKEQLGNKNDNDDTSTNGTINDKEDVLQLPSQRDSNNSQDQNDGENVEDNYLQQNELVTLDGEKNDTGEAITSDEERFLSSKNQLEGGEKTEEVEKEAIDSRGGVKLETEIKGENSFEVEKKAIDSHGGVKSKTEGNTENSLEDTTVNPSSDDAILSLPIEENNEVAIDNESFDKNTVDSQADISTDSETTEHHTMENISSDTRTEDEATNLPNSTEEKELMIPTDNKVAEREAIEFQDNITSKDEANGDNPLVEDTSTESDEKQTVTSSVDYHKKNMELPIIDKALEQDAVDSDGDNASDAGQNDFDEEKFDSKSNEDALEWKGDGTSEAQNAGNNFSIETSSQTSSASEAENFGNNDNSLEILTNEAPNVEVAESQEDNFSKGENSSNIVFEDTTEPNPKEKTSSELDNNDASSGGNDNADSWKEGGNKSG